MTSWLITLIQSTTLLPFCLGRQYIQKFWVLGSRHLFWGGPLFCLPQPPLLVDPFSFSPCCFFCGNTSLKIIFPRNFVSASAFGDFNLKQWCMFRIQELFWFVNWEWPVGSVGQHTKYKQTATITVAVFVLAGLIGFLTVRQGEQGRPC